MKKTLAKIIGVTIIMILLLQNSQVFATTKKELEQQKRQRRLIVERNKIAEKQASNALKIECEKAKKESEAAKATLLKSKVLKNKVNKLMKSSLK